VCSSDLKLGKVGQASCRLARAKDILDTALALLAGNPYFLRYPETPSVASA
jgi:aminoglycoside N3'-acetyltransferase